ncbi:hypothetical protein GJ496_007528 [Pomphorhynchus laevis]|nr:hypothetical protein GJ496_007528 [Pomphorhynchus laevis]
MPPTDNSFNNIPSPNGMSYSEHYVRQPGSNSKGYMCVICGKILTNIHVHIRRHINKKPHVCAICKKGFTNSSDLSFHKRIHNGDKPYKCVICRMRFRTIGNFNSHALMHNNGKRPYQCILCNRIFEQRKDLLAHIRNSSIGNKSIIHN